MSKSVFERYNGRKPFQNNKLINQNPHIINGINHRNVNKNNNVIENLLKPQNSKYDEMKKTYEDIIEERNVDYKRTKQGYKHIIRDREINKDIDNITEEDLIIYRNNQDDKNPERLQHEYNMHVNENDKFNQELSITYHANNYNKNKEKFEFKHSFIKNLSVETEDYEEQKLKSMEEYQKYQKQLDNNRQLCMRITNLNNTDDIPF